MEHRVPEWTIESSGNETIFRDTAETKPVRQCVLQQKMLMATGGCRRAGASAKALLILFKAGSYRAVLDKVCTSCSHRGNTTPLCKVSLLVGFPSGVELQNS